MLLLLHKNIMKNLFYFFIVVVFVVGCSRTREDAVKFNNAVVADQKQIIEAINKLITTFEDTNVTKIEAQYQEHIKLLEEMRSKYANMKPFDEEDDLRKAFIEFIDANLLCAKQEYAQLIEILKKYDEKTYWSYKNKWDSIAHVVLDKEQRTNDKFLEAQKKFAEKYEITLVNK